jgi:hypothetical protein
MPRHRLVVATATALALPFLGLTAATQATAAPPKPAPASDVTELHSKDFGNYTLDGKKVRVPSSYSSRAAKSRSLMAAETPPVGTVRQWIASDSFLNRLYRKDYVLRAVGAKIEFWVAVDTAFPAGDCRTQVPNTTTITDAQAQAFVNEFDNNMFPKETATFSTPPDRDGSNAILGPDANGNGGVYTGGGDKTVALIDNVRDPNFYDFPNNPTYTGGFFSAQFNELLDRNVMTIDAFDWAHRTGLNPPDEPNADPCISRPARPRLYEGTFAHEWQHLLQYYTDPNETIWMNEGLSDFAQTLTGYVDGTRTIFDRGNDSHINCFQGWGSVLTPFNPNPRDCGGPENSLNLWGEGTPSKVLADYGNAYSLMLYLFDHYGVDIMSRLHNDGALQGLASLDAELEAEGTHDMYRLLHDFQTSTLVDRIVGDPKGQFFGRPKSAVTTPSLRATVNFANPDVNDDPGAAPNGADYVRLQKAGGQALTGRDLQSLSFAGSATLPPLPLQWTLVSNDPDRPGNSVLWSGNANNLDSTAVTSVAVPTTNPTLTFLAKYGAEFGFDYGYVVVSTDGGSTYTAIPGDKTGPAPLGPGLNGTTNGFEPHTYDLSAYAGQTILLGFRYVSDGGVNEGGLLIDDVTVGSTVVSDGSSLAPFDSPTEIKPVAVNNWNVRLVGLDEQNQRAKQVEFNGRSSITMDREALGQFSPYPTVVAIVAYDEPTEQVRQYAPYTLTVNGVLQPGGGGGS